MSILSLFFPWLPACIFFACSGLLVIMIGIRWLGTTETTKTAHSDNLHHHSPGSWFAGFYVPLL
jgi:hypothetical protein